MTSSPSASGTVTTGPLTPPRSPLQYAEVPGADVTREARLGDLATAHDTSGENPFRLFRRRQPGWVLACKKGPTALPQVQHARATPRHATAAHSLSALLELGASAEHSVPVQPSALAKKSLAARAPEPTLAISRWNMVRNPG